MNDSYNNFPIPFCEIKIEQGGTFTSHQFVAANGQWLFKAEKWPITLHINHPLYKSKRIVLQDTSYQTVPLIRKKIYQAPSEHNTLAGSYWAAALSTLSRNYVSEQPFEAHFAHKITMESNNNAYLLENINELLKTYAWNTAKSDQVLANTAQQLNDQYLFLMDSDIAYSYHDALHFDEYLNTRQATGIKNARTLSVLIEKGTTNILAPYMLINGKEYISPGYGKYRKRYQISLDHSFAYKDSDSLLCLRIGPAHTRDLHLLQGYAYVKQSDSSLVAWWLWPANTAGNELAELLVSYAPTNEKVIVANSLMRWQSSPFRRRNMSFLLQEIRELKSFAPRRILPDSFDEVVLHFDAQHMASSHLGALNPTTNQREKATYALFDSLGEPLDIGKSIGGLGKLSQGQLPVYVADVNLEELIKVSDFEGLRINLNAATNQRLSPYFSLQGYYGLSTRDPVTKGGMAITINPWKNEKWMLHANYRNDLHEPGEIRYDFDKRQFKEEGNYSFRLPRFDREESFRLAVFSQAIKWHYSGISYAQKAYNPTYSYTHQSARAEEQATNGNPSFRFNEYTLGWRWSYGELFNKIGGERIPRPSNYPHLWAQVNYLSSSDNNAYSILKATFKVQYQLKTVGFGRSFFKLHVGIMDSEAPYFLLFNGRGSLRNPSFVVPNSFETMGINEFFSQGFAHLFFNHWLGRLPIKSKWFRPSLRFTQNMGWGRAIGRERHEGVSFRSMHRGYYESGMVIDNAFIIGDKSGIGLGGGIFYRYGPYQNADAWQNWVIKQSLILRFGD